jgi:hypothetical protein
MIIEDFIMLGRTVPEQSKKHGLVVCSAGYSRELRSFLRVYPITMIDRVPRWSRCQIGLRRNTNDSRIESWRLQNEHDVKVTGKAIKSEEYDLLRSMAAPSIDWLNKERRSLGIIEPKNIGWRFDGMKPNEEYLMSLFPQDQEPRKKPRIMFQDEDGDHDLQIRDWGAHEFIRKQQEQNHCKLWDALKFGNREYDHLLFVGNHNQHRNSWLVISVISERTRPQLDMFEAA